MSDARIVLTSEITVRLDTKAGDDGTIIGSARVSPEGIPAFGKVSDPDFDAYRFISFLMRSRHGVPFEDGYIRLFVHAPAAVWWQWIRHRIGHSFSLESARYHKLRPVFYLPPSDRPMMVPARFSPARPTFAPATPDESSEVRAAHAASAEQAWGHYERMVELGVATELARDVLPFSIYYAGIVRLNPRSLMNLISLRTHDPAAKVPSYPQYEIENAARQVEAVLAEHWPVTHKAFVAHGRVAP